MIHKETMMDGRIRTYSDSYKVRQVGSGVVYDDAIDAMPHEYEETEELLERAEYTEDELVKMTSTELKAVLASLGVSVGMNKENMVDLILARQSENKE